MWRRLGTLVLVLGAALVLALPASAATRGDVTIHVEGTFGAARGSTLPLTVLVRLGGILSGGGTSQASERLLRTKGFLVSVSGGPAGNTEDGDWSKVSDVVCLETAPGDEVGCVVFGGVLGLGTATVSELDPRPGGRLVMDIDFPNAYCVVCQARG